MATVTTEELEKFGKELLKIVGVSVKEFTEAGFLDLATYAEDKAAFEKRFDAIDAINADDDFESLAEKMEQVRKFINDNKDMIDVISANRDEIAALADKVDANIAGLQENIDNVNTKIDNQAKALEDYKEEVKEALENAANGSEELNGKIDGLAGDIEALKGDKDTEGSIAYAVEQERARAVAANGLNADLKTEEKATKVGAINELVDRANASDAKIEENKSAIDVLNGGEEAEGSIANIVKGAKDELAGRIDSEVAGINESITGLDERIAGNKQATDEALAGQAGRIKSVEDILNDTTDADDNTVKGICTRVTEVEQAVLAEIETRATAVEEAVTSVKAYADELKFSLADIDLGGLENGLRDSLGLPQKSSDDDL